jgi:hypothetical protein
MNKFECHKCNKVFGYKHHLIDHLNKKKSCVNDQEDYVDKNINMDIFDKNDIIDSKTMKEYLDKYQCVYCKKQFTRKDNVITHIKNNCKKIKEIESKKHEIFTKLKKLEDTNKKLEEENKRLKEEKDLENKKLREDFRDELNKRLTEEVTKIKQELQLLSKNSTSINGNNNIQNINSHNTDNSINNNFNQQNIVLNNYNKEDMSKLDENVILAIMKRGFQSTVELTRAVHFNPKYPENHNVYIPKINERNGMIYKDGYWKLVDKNELAEDIYENKRDFIIQNLDKYLNKLDENKKKPLLRFLDNDDNDDEAIINTKNDIKKLLYENRHMAMYQKKEFEKQRKKKPLEIIELKPKKYNLVKDKESDSENDSESDSDSSYVSNYSYIHSSDNA